MSKSINAVSEYNEMYGWLGWNKLLSSGAWIFWMQQMASDIDELMLLITVG